jgi:tetratricopeptide (TPR) repeat protein
VGRVHELSVLQAAFDDAVAGRGRLVVIAGEPGIGKTRLCEQVAEYTRQHGATACWGRCYEGAGAPPFWPWVQILRECTKELDPALLDPALGSGDAPLAELVRTLAGAPPRIAADSPESRFQLFDAVARLIELAAARAPLVLLLDDLQGADPSSLLLLQFVVRTLPDSRLLTVATHRPLPAGAVLSETLGELGRVSGRLQLTLAGLSAAEVGEYVRRATGCAAAPAAVALLYRRTEGNPLFLSEFIDAVDAEPGGDGEALAGLSGLAVPPTVRAVIERRLAPLSDACREVLQLAAVVGRDFDGALVETLHPATVAAVHEAVAARIVRPDPRQRGQYRFAHALIRETLQDGLPEPQRRALHRRVGEALEQQPDAAERVAELAYHFDVAGDGAKAVAYAQRAGERAMQLLAFEEAVRLYRLALDVLQHAGGDTALQRCALLVALGEAQRPAGDVEGGKQTMLAAAALARSLGARELQARAVLGYGTKLPYGEEGAHDETLVRLLDEALAAWGQEDDALHARLQARLALALNFSPQRERRTALARDALQMARRLGEPGTLAYALSAQHMIIWSPATLEERIALATEQVRCAERAGDRELAFIGYMWRLVDYGERGDRVGFDADLAACRQLADRLRGPFSNWVVRVYDATCRMMEGDFAEAERLAQEALAIGERANAGAVKLFGVQMFVLGRTRGQLDVLAPMGELFTALAAQYPAVPAYLVAAAAIHAALGHAAEAQSTFECLAHHDFATLPADVNWLMSVSLLTDVCAFLGDSRRAALLYTMLSPYRTQVIGCGGLGYVGPATHYLGMLATVLSRWDDAERDFQEALDLNTRMRDRPWLAYTRYEYAKMLQARGRPDDRPRARQLVTEALETARRLDMPALTQKAETLRERLVADEGTERQPEKTAPPPISKQSAPAAVFRREGDYWIVSGSGHTLRLRDSKGLQYLGYLLRHPNREFHALDLARQESAASAAGHEAVPGGAEAPIEILDAQARAAYTRRLEELREELEEAERHHDAGRTERLRAEIEALVEQLAAAVGLGGRSRTAADASERARIAVTKRVKAAIQRIAAGNPDLGRYLGITVKTGVFCAYLPDLMAPLTWML